MVNRLEIDADADIWFVLMAGGPEGASLVPHQVKMLLKRFGIRRRDRAQVDAYLTAVLERVVAGTDTALPFRLVRWVRVDETPTVLSFGPAPRIDDLQEFLVDASRDDLTAPVVVEEVPAPPGVTIRRSTSQSSPFGDPFTGVRYVVDTGDPEGVGVIHGGDSPERLAAALSDIDDFARTMHFVPV